MSPFLGGPLPAGLTGGHVETVLRSIPGAHGRQVASMEVLASGATAALRAAPPGLTVQGAAAFLATMAQESASFRTTEEYSKTGRYAPYIGRTFEQVTWRDNYAAFGAWCTARGLLSDPAAFVKAPTKLADVRWAWLGGIWFWQAHDLWAYANRGDFLAVQRAVNLGSPTSTKTPAGYAARRAWYAAWLQIGPALLPPNVNDPVTPSTGRPIDMATAKDISVKYNGKQPLTPGTKVDVLVGPDNAKSVIVGASDGVDLVATVEVKDSATGRNVDGSGIRSFFKVVSYKQGTPTTDTSSRVATATDQVSFKGPIAADPDSTRSPRLRLVLDVPTTAPAGLVLDWVQVTGWAL